MSEFEVQEKSESKRSFFKFEFFLKIQQNKNANQLGNAKFGPLGEGASFWET